MKTLYNTIQEGILDDAVDINRVLNKIPEIKIKGTIELFMQENRLFAGNKAQFKVDQDKDGWYVEVFPKVDKWRGKPAYVSRQNTLGIESWQHVIDSFNNNEYMMRKVNNVKIPYFRIKEIHGGVWFEGNNDLHDFSFIGKCDSLHLINMYGAPYGDLNLGKMEVPLIRISGDLPFTISGRPKFDKIEISKTWHRLPKFKFLVPKDKLTIL